MFDMWSCPGCGALVLLPENTPAREATQAEKRLDQIAQASCGCWVGVLSDREVARLLYAILRVDDVRAYRVHSPRGF